MRFCIKLLLGRFRESPYPTATTYYLATAKFYYITVDLTTGLNYGRFRAADKLKHKTHNGFSRIPRNLSRYECDSLKLLKSKTGVRCLIFILNNEYLLTIYEFRMKRLKLFLTNFRKILQYTKFLSGFST